jgi:hypothetical protein
LEKLPAAEVSSQGKPGLKYTELILPKLPDREGQHPFACSPAYQPQERAETQRKPLSKVSAPRLEIRGDWPASRTVCVAKEEEAQRNFPCEKEIRGESPEYPLNFDETHSSP